MDRSDQKSDNAETCSHCGARITDVVRAAYERGHTNGFALGERTGRRHIGDRVRDLLELIGLRFEERE